MKTTSESKLSKADEFIQPSQFEINVATKYIEAQSRPLEKQFVFAYTVRIINKGTTTAQLLRRHWIITDANGETLEVRGDGVIGEQPWIEPGTKYEYTSGTVLHEFMGCMHGSFTMCGEDGIEFDAPIPVFTLAQHDKLH
ncbi:MAG: Co2+/Mg2+ efflux protein ApaG [Gammaproteobacteria bacterium]|nr:MAG: Co2+/Mg2+ efflux protein ApaG [Gammaproteobacteria bacterium]